MSDKDPQLSPYNSGEMGFNGRSVYTDSTRLSARNILGKDASELFNWFPIEVLLWSLTLFAIGLVLIRIWKLRCNNQGKMATLNALRYPDTEKYQQAPMTEQDSLNSNPFFVAPNVDNSLTDPFKRIMIPELKRKETVNSLAGFPESTTAQPHHDKESTLSLPPANVHSMFAVPAAQ